MLESRSRAATSNWSTGKKETIASMTGPIRAARSTLAGCWWPPATTRIPKRQNRNFTTRMESAGSARATLESLVLPEHSRYTLPCCIICAQRFFILNHFQIVDRMKDLVKLQYGEYVSLGKVESELKTCSLVDNVCVYADPTKLYAVALLMPNPDQLKALAEKSIRHCFFFLKFNSFLTIG